MWRIKHRQKKWVMWRSDVYHRIIEIDKERDCAQQRGCWLCRTWRCRATMVAFEGCFGHDFPERRPDHTPAASVTSPLLWRRSVFHLTAHSLPISTLLTHGIVPTSYRRTDTIDTVVTTTQSYVITTYINYWDTRDFLSFQIKIRALSIHRSGDLTMKTKYHHYICINNHKFWIDVITED